MEKGGLFIFLFFVFFLITFVVGVGVDKTKSYHDAINISIGIDGINQTINAIAIANFAFPSHTYTFGMLINPGHNANQIWVSVRDGEMSLSAALSSTNKLCPASPLKTNYTSSPADKSQPYHYANEIQLQSGKTLQEAIDAGDFCYVWYTDTSSCTATCGGGTRTTYCSHNGVQVADSYCYGTKPSVSCNTQSCVWRPFGRGCIPSIYVSCGTSCCPSHNPSGSCSPEGKMCVDLYVGAQCTTGESSTILYYNCTA